MTLFSACNVQFSLDFCHGRPVSFRFLERYSTSLSWPFGQANLLFGIAQRVLYDQMDTFLAQQQADRRPIIGMTQLFIHGGMVKFILPANSGSKAFMFKSMPM